MPVFVKRCSVCINFVLILFYYSIYAFLCGSHDKLNPQLLNRIQYAV